MSGGGGVTATALAQDVYYGDLTDAQNAEVRQWSEHYWARVEGQSASPGTGFSFTSPLLNSHLFNPVRSGRPTLEALNLIGASDCDGAYTPEILNSAPLDEYRSQLRDLMLQGVITTEVGTPENWYHELLILAADPDLGWLVFDEAKQVITIDLPLEEVSGTAHTASLALNVSTQSQQVIATMIAAGQHWRNQCTDVPQWRALITGETSTAEQFAAQVQAYLSLQNTGGSVRGMQASFGVFGELPFLRVDLIDCFILLDATNGNTSGPFQLTSALDARGLLSLHNGAYQAGSSVRYYNNYGCEPLSQVAPGINPRPPVPAGPLPAPLGPGVVPGGGSPPGTGWTPGAWSPFSCRAVPISGGGVNCVCSRQRRWGRWEAGFWGTSWGEAFENETCTDIFTAPPAAGCPNPPSMTTCTGETRH